MKICVVTDDVVAECESCQKVKRVNLVYLNGDPFVVCDDCTLVPAAAA